jgi:galactose mutarotase-like enzyme
VTAAVVDLPSLGAHARLGLVTSTARVELLPSRGALVTRFSVGGDELLYLDEATVVDAAASVRGGIPVLWPVAGRLPEDRYEEDGRSFTMPQHGFARRRAWQVVSREASGDEAAVELQLKDDADSLGLYPRRFTLTYRIALQGARLVLTWRVRNDDDRPLRHAPGFHPYFRVPLEAKERARVETDASWAQDQRTGRPVALGAPDFSQGEIDWHLQDHALPGTLLHRPGLRPVRLSWDDGFETLVLWTLPERAFVCVEPWAANGGALATGEGVRVVAPGAEDVLRLVIEV